MIRNQARRLPRPGIVAALLVLVLFTAGPRAAQDGIPEAEYARINAALLEHHILPRYRRLASAAAGLAAAANEMCSGSGATSALVRERYHDVMDAWLGVQHISFGPVELFMRSYRLYFWPGTRDRVDDALDALLSKLETGSFTLAGLANASVAVQGLPAAEYLLYRASDGHDLSPGSVRCALLSGIAGNMVDMAEGIEEDWTGGEVHFARTFLEPGRENTYYDSHRAATLDLFKSFHGGLQLIADLKLKPVVGGEIGNAKPQLAESRLSGRSLRNIQINLQALNAMYLGEGGPGLSALAAGYGGDEKIDPLLRRAFDQTMDNAAGIEPPLTAATLDPVSRPAVEKLSTQVLALKQIVKTRLAEALGLTVGFNALDGD